MRLARFRRGERIQDVGTDPDVRYTYANERTFLAWSRTSLALVVTGIAATQLLPKFDIEFGRRLIGIPLIVLGAVLEVASYREWAANERAMRLGEPLPRDPHGHRALDRNRDRGCRRHRRRDRRMSEDGIHRFDQESYEQRTDFAWTRSGIALLGATAVFVRHVMVHGFRLGHALAFALLALAATGWGIGVLGWGLAHRQSQPSTPRIAGELAAVSVGTVALAVAGLVVTFVS